MNNLKGVDKKVGRFSYFVVLNNGRNTQRAASDIAAWHVHSLRVHTEWRLPISGLHPIMMEKSALAVEGGRCTPTPFQPYYHSALQRKYHLWIPFPGIARPQSQFPLSCVYVRFIYSQDQSTYLAAEKQTDRSWKYINLSQIHEWSVGIGRQNIILFWK